MERLNKLLEKNQKPPDMRGKHVNRGNTLDPVVLNKIDEHISSFPTKVSHYTSHPITYLQADLTVKKMHELFTEKYPDLKSMVKYEFYFHYFRGNYVYRFGRPQVDVCSTCEKLNTKIKSTTLNAVSYTHLDVYKRQA